MERRGREIQEGGDAIKGTVVKVNPFGAFVRVDGDIQGLCHISEFGTDEQMKKTIAVGETYDFYVQSVSGKEHRMGLGFGKAKAKSTGSGHRAGSNRRKKRGRKSVEIIFASEQKCVFPARA